jgi:uncharacterized phage protein gp47/JayE
MATLPTTNVYVTAFINAVERNLGRAIDASEGSTWDKLAGGIASMMRRSDAAVVRMFDKHILDRAIGDDLDTYCRQRGPVRRFPPSKARGRMVMFRDSVANGGGLIEAGTEFRVAYKGRSVIFEVAYDHVVSSSAPSVTLAVEAQTAGSDSNVGLIVNGYEIKATGLPSAIYDSNFYPVNMTVSGGSDTEKDELLRQRQRLYEQSRQKGTRAAIAYGAMLVPGVKHVVLASYDDPNMGARGVVYVGDENWQSSTEMQNEVAQMLEEWRVFGPSLNVYGTEQSNVEIQATVRMARELSRYNQASLRLALERKAVAYFAERIDPFSYDLTLLSGALAASNNEISGVSLTFPVSAIPSPLTREAIELSGFPSPLTAYRTEQVYTQFTIQGS